MITVDRLERLTALLDRVSTATIQIEIPAESFTGIQAGIDCDINRDTSCDDKTPSEPGLASLTASSPQLVPGFQVAGSERPRLTDRSSSVSDYPMHIDEGVAIVELSPDVTERITQVILQTLTGQ